MSYSTDRWGAGSYNGFSKADRYASLPWYRKQVELLRNGQPSLIPPAERCLLCWQAEGCLEWHTEDYNLPYDQHTCEWVLCYRCHMVLHCQRTNPRAWQEYLVLIQAGWQFAPTGEKRQSGWGVICRENLSDAARRCDTDDAGQLQIVRTSDLIWIGPHPNCHEAMMAAGEMARRRRDLLGPICRQAGKPCPPNQTALL